MPRRARARRVQAPSEMTRASSNDTCTTSPPPASRFCRARATSTSIRRINWAETAKKCVRFCHCTRARIDQPEVRLVDQRRGLQGVACPFTLHVPMRQAAELVVDERHQPLQRPFVPRGSTPAGVRLSRRIRPWLGDRAPRVSPTKAAIHMARDSSGRQTTPYQGKGCHPRTAASGG